MMRVILALCLIGFTFSAFAQQASIKVTNPRYEAYKDSLMELDYDYMFPIWGDRVYKKGIDIPYPAGIMFNTFVASQKMVIDEISLGVNESEMVDFSDIIEFSDVEANIVNFNVRPDIYILPFWNIYGVFGYSFSETRVVLSAPITLETFAQLQGVNYGVGTNFAFGFGPVWFNADANMIWADLDKFDKPVRAVNTSFRIGHTFIDQQKPERNVAIWVGAFGSFIENRTVGAIDIREVMPGDKLNEFDQKFNEWYQENYDDLRPGQKIVADKFKDFLDDRENRELVVKYDLAKRPQNPWNMVIGFQYQFNKNWQLRGEMGTFGGRTQFLGSLNYRFRI